MITVPTQIQHNAQLSWNEKIILSVLLESRNGENISKLKDREIEAVTYITRQAVNCALRRLESGGYVKRTGDARN